MKETDKYKLIDKLVLYIAQSRAYKLEKGNDSIAYRLKTGNETEQDREYINWAIKFLRNKPIYFRK